MNIKKLIFLSLLVSIGLTLSIIENMIPLPIPVPGVKLGLVNMVFLITLVLFGFKEALIVVLLRSITLAVAIGNVSGLMYSIPSSVISTTVMAIVYKNFSNYFSLIGVSLFGAVTYNITQIGVASFIMQNIKIFSYLPIMSLMSIFTGYFVGLGSKFSIDNIKVTLKKYL
ncbi:heptaprenyl diphosphate synthase component I [Gottschalkia acidurici 9a]|uniref:Heptaprenyl diphosphate synthase component I n=1 Tax=Gottschalkia acidurici (strain ATCC 7906 / DSM 604 / BCRC 14475 / CIP 104303 / KCTC 5404 / NCIMB 10678 / 9a) TaxID=1128398 RepID=K0AVW7_GOTA9|nr:Gx transporter family protein [Gottschalkia acidurici]AFS78018.1 heptaprenyl diphosphate synthase component I [Gottschalkia acidurici 9a]